MWARVARFEGDPATLDERVEKLREAIEAGNLPPELAESNLLMFVDRESGGMLGMTLFESEEAMRRGDAVMNAGPGRAGSRASVEFYEVPLHTFG
jgi:hypothetical protein